MKWFILCKSTGCKLSPEVDDVSKLESWWTSGEELGYRMTVRCRPATLIERILSGVDGGSARRERDEIASIWASQIRGQSQSYQWGF